MDNGYYNPQAVLAEEQVRTPKRERSLLIIARSPADRSLARRCAQTVQSTIQVRLPVRLPPPAAAAAILAPHSHALGRLSAGLRVPRWKSGQ